MCLFGVESCRDAIQVIDTFASIMTIAGVILAFYVALRWQTQENYSFVRDKIFELELAVSELFNYEQHLIINITNALIHQREGQDDQNIHAVKDEVASRMYLRGKLLEYDLKLDSLRILKVKIDSELFINGSAVHKLIDERIEHLLLPENLAIIELLRSDLISKVQERQKLMLKHLEVARKAI
jgi:hypothetical protein